MSRLTDATGARVAYSLPALPIVDWASIGHSAPTPVTPWQQDPNAALPKADVVIVTWASAEWSALDHVFLDSATHRTRAASELDGNWQPYTRNVGAFSSGLADCPLWGNYRCVTMKGTGGRTLTVLLFQSNAHLAHPPYLNGLVTLTRQILTETQASWIYSIGTAGGTRLDLRLGDTVVTNAGHLRLQVPENLPSPLNNTTFTGTAFPSPGLLKPVESLLIKMNSVATDAVLASMLDALHMKQPAYKGIPASITLDDLQNAALQPSNLGAPRALAMEGMALLTTDYFYIAAGPDDEQWSVLEMDDAVIAYAVGQMGRKYAFVRNISDPVVPASTGAGATLPAQVRDNWSGAVYTQFGLQTSFNGALVTWALVTETP